MLQGLILSGKRCSFRRNQAGLKEFFCSGSMKGEAAGPVGQEAVQSIQDKERGTILAGAAQGSRGQDQDREEGIFTGLVSGPGSGRKGR
jgi:hypothetical protein